MGCQGCWRSIWFDFSGGSFAKRPGSWWNSVLFAGLGRRTAGILWSAHAARSLPLRKLSLLVHFIWLRFLVPTSWKTNGCYFIRAVILACSFRSDATDLS